MSNGTTTWNFTYNADGLRTKRTNGSTTYSYVYNGDKLSQMTVGSNLLQFSYDAAGTPMAVLYNGTTYYYATNLQGDVIAILDATGAAVVEYTYDAWGNPISTTGSMASTLGATNPLRYRGYVYDSEYDLYYLQSRYYDPEVGRFLNADNALAGVGGNLRGYNLFSYCLNNPVNMDDIYGNWPKWLSGTLNAVSGALQMVAGAAMGVAAGWTGVGAVAAGVLLVNGAATATQGVGQIVNHVTRSNRMREDNVIRSGVQRVGYSVAGNTGATVAGIAYDATVLAASLYAPFASKSGSSTSQSGFVSRGSTATRQPSNLTEKLALEQVMSNPQGTKLPITMNDPRWPASEGWVKMQQIVNTNAVGKVCIHYVYNEVLGVFDDFKIK